MRGTAVSLLQVLAAGALAACASQDEGDSSAGGSAGLAPIAPEVEQGARANGRDPFTRTSEIEIDGEKVGYLVEYQPVPLAVDVERALPTGSYRIQGLDFEDVGFVTPSGEVYRYAGTNAVALGNWPLDSGLIVFYGSGKSVRLRPLLPSKRKPAAAPAPKDGEADSAAGEPTDEGAPTDEE